MSGRPRSQPHKKARKRLGKSGSKSIAQVTSTPETTSQPSPTTSLVQVAHKTSSWKGQGREGSMSDFESDLDPGEQSNEECEGDDFLTSVMKNSLPDLLKWQSGMVQMIRNGFLHA